MKKNNLNEDVIDPSHLCRDVKRSVPDSIPEIQSFILRKVEELTKLRSDPEESTKPFNPSQMSSVAIRYAEAKMGRLLKESGADKDDQLLPEGLDREECNFFIKLPQFDQFIKGALDWVMLTNRDVAKWEFSKIGPNGDKILKELINKGIARELYPGYVWLGDNISINIEDVRNIAGSDFDKIWAIFQRHNAIVTWKNVFLEAVLESDGITFNGSLKKGT